MNTSLSRKLVDLVNLAIPEIRLLSVADLTHKPVPNKWSKMEILGHLIDSAGHNYQRLISVRFQQNLIFDGYDQDQWVRANNYQHRDLAQLLQLWQHLNFHLAYAFDLLPSKLREKRFAHHNFHEICLIPKPIEEAANISYLMSDYIRHLEHHLNQIL